MQEWSQKFKKINYLVVLQKARNEIFYTSEN